ncbi:hypothetical protein [Roseomonas sp. BN140053]|uniref:hypothetical protein n=1 Tax=Roseomonas sp. BN140053 TaxID=3391898 RepID=UPI0039EB99EB
MPIGATVAAGAGMHARTKEFLRYLSQNPGVRNMIAAPDDRSVVYAAAFLSSQWRNQLAAATGKPSGNRTRAMWEELERLKSADRARNDFVMLPDILKELPSPPGADIGVTTMYGHLEVLDRLEPWNVNGFIAWRAVSGIYASNARGRVRFCVGEIGAGPDGKADWRGSKVIAATEMWVLLRNREVDEETRSMAEYLIDCVRSKNPKINVALT